MPSAQDEILALRKEVFAQRKKIIAQRKETISLLKMVGEDLIRDSDSDTYPKWIRDRLTDLGEDI